MEDNSNFFSEPFYSYRDDYEVVKLVHSAAGGITEIYQTRKSLKRFAVKALKKELRDDPVYVSMLRKEFEIGFQLENQHIIRTYAFEHIPELGYCIILEWIEGSTLDDILNEVSLSTTNYVRIATEICDALTYLHSNMIVHQDIKPSNIMITADSHIVKLIDMGFADSPSFAAIKQAGGTREFAAPEQLSAGAKEKSHLSDIYSLGKLLNQLPIRHSKGLEKLICAMLADDPAMRPQSAEEVKKRILNSAGRSHRWYVFIRAVIFILLIGGICLYFPLYRSNSEREANEDSAIQQDNINRDIASNKSILSIEDKLQDTLKGKNKSINKGESAANKKNMEIVHKQDMRKDDKEVDKDTESNSDANNSGFNSGAKKDPVHWMILLTGEETLRKGKRYRKSDPEWEEKTRNEMTSWVKSHTEGEEELRSQCLATIEKAIGMLKEG